MVNHHYSVGVYPYIVSYGMVDPPWFLRFQSLYPTDYYHYIVYKCFLYKGLDSYTIVYYMYSITVIGVYIVSLEYSVAVRVVEQNPDRSLDECGQVRLIRRVLLNSEYSILAADRRFIQRVQSILYLKYHYYPHNKG